MKKEKKKPVIKYTWWIEESQKQSLKRYAKKLKISESEVIRSLVSSLKR